jgi:hypothetical protein
MHCAGYTHPTRIDPPAPNADAPYDNGKYYGTPPLRAELCIAGQQSDLLVGAFAPPPPARACVEVRRPVQRPVRDQPLHRARHRSPGGLGAGPRRAATRRTASGLAAGRGGGCRRADRARCGSRTRPGSARTHSTGCRWRRRRGEHRRGQPPVASRRPRHCGDGTTVAPQRWCGQPASALRGHVIMPDRACDLQERLIGVGGRVCLRVRGGVPGAARAVQAARSVVTRGGGVTSQARRMAARGFGEGWSGRRCRRCR